MRLGFDLPPLMFTQDEVEAVIVGLALLGQTGDIELERAAKSAAAKIANVLPEGARRTAPLHVSRWSNIPKTTVAPSTLRRFIREEAELTITYVDLAGQGTTHDIKPLAILYYVDSVLLAAWCELRQAFRHFRIDRIKHYAATGQHFTGASEKLLKQWELDNELP